YGTVVVPSINGYYGNVCNRNAVISRLLEKSDSLDISYYVNHLFLNTNFQIINDENLKKLLFTKNKKVVYKVENSFQGKGIYIFDEKSFDIKVIKRLGNGVFQIYIEQHPFFSDFNNSSVATIRITTTSEDNGDINARAGFFKFGREKDTHVQTSSAIKIPIDIKDGRLYEDAYFPDWSSTKELPDSKLSFSGKTLPFFNDCLVEVKKLHARIPFVRCVGWDIIIDAYNQVKLIELNGGHNGIRFHQTVQGPCFKGLNWENLSKM
ncbi:sugar-transfer associated ATP-grasp domain-containing protein, partial [Gelidibacter algens]